MQSCVKLLWARATIIWDSDFKMYGRCDKYFSDNDAKWVSLVGPVKCVAAGREMLGTRQTLRQVLIESTSVAQGENKRLLHIDVHENMNTERI